MSKTIELIEKELKSPVTKARGGFYLDIETFKQIKCELEAWEELNKTFEIGVDEQIEEIYIKGKNYYGNERTIWGYSKDGTQKVKKALEVE